MTRLGWATVQVVVAGDYACFTRPENKVERVSYPVMTPTAARGVLEAIYWKPAFTWEVREIAVLKEIRTMGLTRNEVEQRASVEQARAGFIASAHRTQRHAVILRDVCYRIKAVVRLRPGSTDSPTKHWVVFQRRVARGQCYRRPYLGCREFSAFFWLATGTETPIPVSRDLGWMLHDLVFAPDGSGHAEAHFFSARLDEGVLRIPPRVAARAEEA